MDRVPIANYSSGDFEKPNLQWHRRFSKTVTYLGNFEVPACGGEVSVETRIILQPKRIVKHDFVDGIALEPENFVF